METHYIEYQGIKYPVNEPTIELWQRLMGLKEWTEDTEFAVELISQITGLDRDTINKSDWHNVLSVSQNISNYLLNESKVFHKEFEFDGVKYGFIDLPNLTFGEFIDIDTFLSKTELERRNEINLLMAMLYREIGEDGKLVPYDSSQVGIRAKKFKKLGVKYVTGSTSFFLRLEKTLHQNLKPSFWNLLKTKILMTWMLVKAITLISIGVGLVHLSNLRKKISQKLKR
jgi:hypothetical protein